MLLTVVVHVDVSNDPRLRLVIFFVLLSVYVQLTAVTRQWEAPEKME